MNMLDPEMDVHNNFYNTAWISLKENKNVSLKHKNNFTADERMWEKSYIISYDMVY